MAIKKGFTLIELLVVIAIIALLLAVLVPALKRAKQQAQSVICLSRLKEWGSLYAMYAMDYKDNLPPGWNGKRMWTTYLMSYYQNTDELRLCPTAEKYLSQIPGGTPGEFTAWGIFGDNGYPIPIWGERGQYGSYSVNGWALDPLETGLPGTYNVPKGSTYYDYYWRKFTNAKSPSQVPLMGDGMWEGANPLDTDSPGPSQGVAAPDNAIASAGVSSYCLDRHNGGPILLFMDKQVRKVGMKELWRLKWHTKWDSRKTRSWPQWMSRYQDY